MIANTNLVRMFGRKSMSGVRDIVRGGPLVTRVVNAVSRKPNPESFSLDAVLRDACAKANVAVPKHPESQLPDYRWWNKLCKACAGKVTNNYGGQLLRLRLINALSSRLAIEEIYRINGSEIMRESVQEPVVVMGLPRSNGHMAAHVLSRSGLFLAPRQSDTFALPLLQEMERRDTFHKHFFGFGYLHPDFLCVRLPIADQIDDDLTLHLMTPQSYAWGLLHGLDEFLLECLEESQVPVYAQVKRALQLFQWYRRCGHFSVPVTRQYEPLNNPMETQTYGTKHPITCSQWLLYSPFAILSSEALVDVFPDLKLIWVHRAVGQCIPSLCSSLCLHNALYTGKPPTDSQLASMGEKVLGLFGSGAGQAVEFYRSFDPQRMVHWSNRDVKRHASRLAGKTLDFFGIELDRYRRMQMINGQTEYTASFRPFHDAQMPYFCLHEGVIGDAFQDYMFQFEAFAYEKRFGITVKEYTPLAATADQMGMGSLRISGKEPNTHQSSVGAGQPMAGHFLQESKGFR